MDETEEMALQRMLDITRATLYFAKGVILVEGISESLLLPVLAKRLGYDLSRHHVTVIPICGVAFETFSKLFHPAALGIPAAIVTDADPPVAKGATWEDDAPENDNGAYKISDRTNGLLQLLNGHDTVRVYHSQVTLEYDLAEAGDANAALMVEAWKACFKGMPGTFNSQRLAAAGNDRQAKALCAWRGICRATHSGSKAEFAQRLAACLELSKKEGKDVVTFEVPNYIKNAIEFVVSKVKSSVPLAGGGG
jgi:putative ATP-dependent endonuclease of OLD family